MQLSWWVIFRSRVCWAPILYGEHNRRSTSLWRLAAVIELSHDSSKIGRISIVHLNSDPNPMKMNKTLRRRMAHLRAWWYRCQRRQLAGYQKFKTATPQGHGTADSWKCTLSALRISPQMLTTQRTYAFVVDRAFVRSLHWVWKTLSNDALKKIVSNRWKACSPHIKVPHDIGLETETCCQEHTLTSVPTPSWKKMQLLRGVGIPQYRWVQGKCKLKKYWIPRWS